MSTLARAVQLQSQRLLHLPLPLSPLLLHGTVCSQLMNGNQVKKIKGYDEFEAVIQKEILEDVEKVWREKTEDRDANQPAVDFLGMPKGVFRDKLMFGCNVAAIFVASSVVGTLCAEASRLA
uniref:Uncharacterized protein n=1 Tax=Leersia perrieri TaxID=77586 RepID=A0A0D9WUQ0_9ORYZ